jgi:hypothetical protein
VAVVSFISPVGVLVPPAYAPVSSRVASARDQAAQPPPDVERQRVLDLRHGLGPIQRLRAEVQEAAAQGRERAQAETDELADVLAAQRLAAAAELVTRVRDLAREAQQPDQAPEERVRLEQEARAAAVQAGGFEPVRTDTSRMDAAVAAAAVRPEMLGLNDLARAAQEPGAVAGRLEAQASVALERIRSAREALPPPPGAEPPPIEPTQPEGVRAEEERARIESPEEAANVAREVRSQVQQQAGDPLLVVTNILPQNAIAVLLS